MDMVVNFIPDLVYRVGELSATVRDRIPVRLLSNINIDLVMDSRGKNRVSFPGRSTRLSSSQLSPDRMCHHMVKGY